MNNSKVNLNEVTSNNAKQSEKNNKGIIVFLVVIGLIIFGALCYFFFLNNPKDDPSNNKDSNSNQITNNMLLEKKYLKKGDVFNPSNRFSYKGTISIKNINGVIKYSTDSNAIDSSYTYIDSANHCQENGEYYENCGIIYETNKFIFITNTSSYHAINENGDLIYVDDDIYDSTNGIYIKDLYDLRMEGDKVVASVAFVNERVDGKVEFVYEVDKITIKEIKNDITPNNKNTELDLSQLSTKPFKIVDFEPEKLKELKGEKTFEKYESKLKVSVNGKKVSILYKSEGKQIKKEYDNVDKVVYSDYGNCSANFYVYMFSGNKIYLIDVIYRDEEITEKNIAEEISNTNNYTDLYLAVLHPSTCDFIPFWLGLTEDGKYYDLSTSTEYLKNTYYYYDDGDNYVKSDKSFKLDGKSGNLKVGFVDEISELLVAYIDENDYLYEYDYETGYKKLSESKVIEIKKENDLYDIFFANGDRRRLMDYVEAYK